LYRILINGSNTVWKQIDFYEAWNKLEKAKEWRTKQAQIGDFEK
jgi:hypothetical protein